MSDEQLVKIKIPLHPNDASGVDAEWLWAEPTGQNGFILRNVPFLVDGLSFGDTVAARLDGGAFVFDKVINRGGHSTYRIYAKVDRSSADLESLFETLRSMKCEFERVNNRLVGVDVLPEADIYGVYQALEDGENLGIMEFDEGHCGHPLKPEP
jgi:Domain of unknown function (DUF4265)